MLLPSAPTNTERDSYVERHLLVLTAASILAFTGMAVSLTRFALQGVFTVVYLVPIAFMIVYFVISLISNSFTRDFDLEAHEALAASWRPERYPSIDIFLPTCGEDMEILRNTAEHVARLRYPGPVMVYSLDDSARSEVQELAAEFGFVYLSRPNRGWFKKAGNLRYGYERSSGEFVVVFDADFCARPDFLVTLMPYFDAEPDLGIVQSPQFFRTASGQNWIERGAGAVQELFYRVAQTSRQVRGAAICVGSNAIYRRRALDSNGGGTLIEHSEDVHTGFDLYRHGWRLRYIPVNLATGICPSTLRDFLAQQYRWCMGSMSLLSSAKFWRTDLRLRQRLCYLSGISYYIETALLVIFAPLIPLTMVYVFPENVRLLNYVLLVPAVVYAFVVFPLWHRCRYRFEAWSVKMVYGWAHLFAIVDKLRGKPMGWSATLGRRSSDKQARYRALRLGVVLWGGGTALAWLGGVVAHLGGTDPLAWVPMLGFATVYAASVGRIIGSLRTETVIRRNLTRREGDPLPPYIPHTVVSEAGSPTEGDDVSSHEPSDHSTRSELEV
jgi:cellulose synthase (UDP-forming)